MPREGWYVVLESTTATEVFLTTAELQEKLVTYLELPDLELPYDLQPLPDAVSQAQHLIDTGCELRLPNGGYVQWYAVRLEKT
ncbi:chlororespiratory reduction protein 7 [Parathermosynechococcus lividus]